MGDSVRNRDSGSRQYAPKVLREPTERPEYWDEWTDEEQQSWLVRNTVYRGDTPAEQQRTAAWALRHSTPLPMHRMPAGEIVLFGTAKGTRAWVCGGKRTCPRPRGAGRPRAQSSRRSSSSNSSKAGSSGDEPPGPSPGAVRVAMSWMIAGADLQGAWA